ILVDGEVTFSFVATNEGGNATALFDPCGPGNPRIEIRDANGTALDLTGPSMHCMVAASFQDMPSGAQVTSNLTWDGRAWNGTERAPVAPGEYVAHATFVARRDGADVSVTLDI